MKPPIIAAALILISVITACCIYLHKSNAEYSRQVEASDICEDYSPSAVIDNAQSNDTLVFEKIEKLKKDYPSAMGWLYIPGTSIDYPVMQGEDNSFYLHHAPDGSYIYSGSIFADYRCGIPESGQNLIIYGHNMGNNRTILFQNLTLFKDKDFFDKHTTGYFITDQRVYTLQIFSYNLTYDESTYYQAQFYEGEFASYVDFLNNNYKQKADFSLTERDALVMLSTCSYEYKNARTIVIARVIA